MRALFLNCTLKRAPEPSNTEALSRVVMTQMEQEGVECELIRVAEFGIPPGVKTDMGGGDEWPRIHQKIADAEILVIATPTWLGQASSFVQRVLERMDAMLSETQDDGRPFAFDKVAGIVITGNEDGAHHIVGTTSQALIDIGFTAPAHCWTYWHLGPGPGPNYLDTEKGHDYAHRVGRNAARNLVAAARALKQNPLPKPEQS